MSKKVDFWFDSICPFAWITSRWIKEVEKVRDIEVTFRVMSLSVLNEGRNLDADYKALMERAYFPARAAIAVQERHGAEKLDQYYTAVGTKIHNENRGDDYLAAVEEALNELGFEDAQEILDIAGSTQLDEQLKASHQEGISKVGDDVGTPIISLDGTTFFGPVMTRIPRGEEAGKIFDGAFALAEFPYFYEIKRSRTTEPEFN